MFNNSYRQMGWFGYHGVIRWIWGDSDSGHLAHLAVEIRSCESAEMFRHTPGYRVEVLNRIFWNAFSDKVITIKVMF